MDVFKLAFETIIVGLLAFLWLGLATYLIFPEFLKGSIGWIDSAAVDKYKTALGLGVLTMAYCLGSAISPISKQLVNDEHWPLNEDAIRCQLVISQPKNAGILLGDEDLVTRSKPGQCSHWGPIFEKDIGMGERIRRFRRLAAPLPRDVEDTSEKADRDLRAKISASFQQKEADILLKAHDEAEPLTQLYERIVVLRGVVFNGLVLLLICLSAYFARINGHISHWTVWIRPGCGIVVVVLFAIFAFLNGIDDLNNGIFDPPVLEFLLLVITGFGIAVVVKGAKEPLLRTKRYVLIALFFTGLGYGGWIGSEILYDQQVINWQVVLPK